MDPERVRAYLQVACAGLGFDIGEIWWTSNENGASSVAAIEEPHNGQTNKPRKLRFVQLYTSKSFENRRSELVNPEEDDGGGGDDLAVSNTTSNATTTTGALLKKKHKLSPSLVDAIAKTTQVVWATSSSTHEGLAGSSGMRLLTAVGMPVAMDHHGNMCCVVMFSPNAIASTDDALEYLQNISQCATSSSIPCVLPVVHDENSAAIMTSCSSMVVPKETQQRTLRAFHKSWGDGVAVQFASLDHQRKAAEVTEAPKDTFGIPMLPDGVTEEIFDEASYGVWTTIMEQALTDEDMAALEFVSDNAMAMATTDTVEPVVISEDRKTRLEEFLFAFLGLSSFDLADVWVYSNESDSLQQITSVAETDALSEFQYASATALIDTWDGAVGRAFASGDPVWTSDPAEFRDPRREAAFRASNIQTVLAVPVFSPTRLTPTCVVTCYALVPSRSVAFVLKFVQQALRLLWSGLDTVEPHDAVGKNLWQDVTPVCLGEMAADVEMQHHFMSKKRPHASMTTTTEEQEYAPTMINHTVETLQQQQQQQQQQVPMPSMQEVQNHLFDAVKSVSEAIPFRDTTGNRSKRAHVGGGAPLAMPQPLPSAVIQSIPPPTSTTQEQTPASFPLYCYAIDPNKVAPTTITTVDQQHSPTLAASHQDPSVTIDPISFLTAIQFEQQRQRPCAPENIISLLGDDDEPSSTTTATPAVTLNATNYNATGAAATYPPSHHLQPCPPRTCKIQGCTNDAIARRPYCPQHSGTRLCEKPGCKKCAQGSTRFCIAHGGGRRCTFPGCDKGARDKFFCAAHGGGKRCQYGGGCTKSAVGGSTLCTAHGGGRRCSVEGCAKSAQSSTKFCVKHGGGKKCAHDGCSKVARGKTQFCASHGGGVRCRLEGCNRVAIGKFQLCRTHGGFSSRAAKGGEALALYD